jgi:hypothetical protein
MIIVWGDEITINGFQPPRRANKFKKIPKII